MKNSFAVKRGKTFTTFATSAAANKFWRETLGGVLMVRGENGKWHNIF